ncbi:hypothetical protein [Zoogloea oryzae]|uniref:hypothetical protein n=1 Tax=Zoogloea oryzae TaxID=310767 RepID=UPI0024E173BD|nr:hypothetical protein [Zoogloea oryzae]
MDGLIAFQLVTLWLFYFGPIAYERPAVEGGAGIAVVCFLALLKLGALSGRRFRFAGSSGPTSPLSFLRFSILTTMVLVPLTIYFRSGGVELGTDLGDIYSASHARRQSGDSAIEYVRMVFGYSLFGFLPLALIYWEKILGVDKFLVVLCVLLNVYMSYAMGVNKYIFDVIIIFSAMFYLLWGHTLFNTIRGWVASMVILCSLFGAGAYFTEGQVTREGSAAVSGVSTSLGAYSEYNIDDGPLLVFYSAITTYLTQGYRALDLSMHEPFVFTWGVGNSTFLARQADRVLGSSIQDNTYPARIEKYGWDRYVQWSSFYLWWASDLTYIGVGILMFVLGFLYSSIGNTLLTKGDAASILLFAYLIIVFFYLSANNQVMQSGESVVGFFSLMIPYFIKRRLVRIRT